MEEILDRVKRELVVLPGAPKEILALNPQVGSILGRAKMVRTLSRMSLKGIVVTKPIPLHTASEEASASLTTQSEKVAHGSTFFPADSNFDKVIIVKHVSDLPNDTAVTQITESICDQLECLDRVVQQILAKSKVSPDKFNVQLFVSYPSKVKNRRNPEFERLKSNCGDLETKPGFANFHVTVNFTDEKALEKKILACVKRSSVQSDVIPKLILHCDSILKECFYQLSAQPLKVFSSEPATFEQVDELIKVFNVYFPDRHEKLQSVPHFNQITDNMMYAYNQQGELDDFYDYAGYLGEVRLFSEKLLANLKNPVGILLKSFSADCLKTILDSVQFAPQEFEMDWLYLGQNHIIAFEVGMSEKEQQPKTAIQNKITQTIEKIVPQMQLILYSFCVSYQKMTKEVLTGTIRSLAEKLFKVVIFLPNIKYDNFLQEIKAISKDCEDSSITEEAHSSANVSGNKLSCIVNQNRHQLSNFVLFLLEDNYCNRLLQLNDSLELEASDYSLQTLFSSSISAENKLFDYICSLFSAACLKAPKMEDTKANPLDIDNRFSKGLPHYLKKLSLRTKQTTMQSLDDVTLCSKVILSPQQHRILDDFGKTHLILTGQPGSGKTTLLLAKCEQLASRQDVEKIYFIYDRTKLLFRKYLNKIVETVHDEANKIKLIEVTTDVDAFKLALKNVDNSRKPVKGHFSYMS